MSYRCCSGIESKPVTLCIQTVFAFVRMSIHNHLSVHVMFSRDIYRSFCSPLYCTGSMLAGMSGTERLLVRLKKIEAGLCVCVFLESCLLIVIFFAYEI